MSAEVIALIVLVLVFVVASIRSVNMGALALVAAAVVGATVYDVGPTQVLSGFPGNLFVILVGVTYLFALAKNNGTVDWIVHAAVRAVGGRVALIPWAMFVVCAAITAIGAITPAAVAIVAPVALGFGKRFRIHPVLIGILVVMGATGGSFSPIGIFGAITNGVVADSGLPGQSADPVPGLLRCGTAHLGHRLLRLRWSGTVEPQGVCGAGTGDQRVHRSGRRLRGPDSDTFDGDRNPAVGGRVGRTGRRPFGPRRRHRNSDHRTRYRSAPAADPAAKPGRVRHRAADRPG